MADAVLPKTIFAPAISMICGENDSGCPKTFQQRFQQSIRMLQTGTLPTTAGLTPLAAWPLKRHAGIVVAVPKSTCMPIGHMSLPHIQKQEQRLPGGDIPALRFDPGELFRQLPGAARIKESVKFISEAATGLCGGVKPSHRTAAD